MKKVVSHIVSQAIVSLHDDVVPLHSFFFFIISVFISQIHQQLIQSDKAIH